MNLKDLALKKILPVAGGALAGYAYYYFIGCNTGSCPITSNPYISTVYGAIAGVILALPGKKKAPKTEEAKDGTDN